MAYIDLYLLMSCLCVFFIFYFILFFNFTILYWLCHISKWIHKVLNSSFLTSNYFVPVNKVPNWMWALFFYLYFILIFSFIILYWFCHISTWICHSYTHVPHPEPSSLLPPHPIPLGHPRAPAPSIQYCALKLDWRVGSLLICLLLSFDHSL